MKIYPQEKEGGRERGRERRKERGREGEKQTDGQIDSTMELCKPTHSRRQRGNGEPLTGKGQPVPG